jgi:hypothetical protein
MCSKNKESSLRATVPIDTDISFINYIKKYSYQNIGKEIIKFDEFNKLLQKLQNQLQLGNK